MAICYAFSWTCVTAKETGCSTVALQGNWKGRQRPSEHNDQFSWQKQILVRDLKRHKGNLPLMLKKDSAAIWTRTSWWINKYGPYLSVYNWRHCFINDKITAAVKYVAMVYNKNIIYSGSNQRLPFGWLGKYLNLWLVKHFAFLLAWDTKFQNHYTEVMSISIREVHEEFYLMGYNAV
jgi:hypothetical protein